jgi:sulfur-oxidizing protein SoxY
MMAAVITVVLAGMAPPAAAQQVADTQRGDAVDPEASPIWQKVRVSLFQSRPIAGAASHVVTLESPSRAADAAVVPIAIRAQFDQSESRYIEKLYLIVDKNPSPVSAVFTLSPLSGRADIETRIRVEDYSFIRAVAELNDGSLHMATRFIKASGGCSAPAGRDMAQAMANLGRWKLRLEGEPQAGQPLQAQLMISHPNESGLAMDQLTRTYASPHFVRQVEVSYGGQRVLSADIDFSISENPNFRFWFTPGERAGELAVKFVDNKDLAFDGSVGVPGGRRDGSTADPR